MKDLGVIIDCKCENGYSGQGKWCGNRGLGCLSV